MARPAVNPRVRDERNGPLAADEGAADPKRPAHEEGSPERAQTPVSGSTHRSWYHPKAVSKRSSISPEEGAEVTGSMPMRRTDVRREVSERVVVRREGGESLEGWALNVSRGGVRAIFEASVELGEEVQVSIGEGDGSLVRRGRVVWKQDEPDGTILGVEFYRSSVAIRSVSVPPEGSDAPPED